MAAAYLKTPQNPQVTRCKQKHWYRTEERARWAGATRLAEAILWPYLCPICSNWHLTRSRQYAVRPIDATDARTAVKADG